MAKRRTSGEGVHFTMTPEVAGTRVTIWRDSAKLGVIEATDEGVRVTSQHLTDGGQLFSFGEQLALVIVLTKERRGLKDALSRELSPDRR
jgi:hypothetical protein